MTADYRLLRRSMLARISGLASTGYRKPKETPLQVLRFNRRSGLLDLDACEEMIYDFDEGALEAFDMVGSLDTQPCPVYPGDRLFVEMQGDMIVITPHP